MNPFFAKQSNKKCRELSLELPSHSKTEFIDILSNRFEAVCHKHILQIKKALGILGVYTQTHYWQSRGDGSKKGTQIDMLIERADKTVMIVEIKYYNKEFAISKSYADNLRAKIETFRENDKAHNSIMLVILSTYGVEQNSYSSMVNCNLGMDVLFG